jgi:hypothetical protein
MALVSMGRRKEVHTSDRSYTDSESLLNCLPLLLEATRHHRVV